MPSAATSRPSKRPSVVKLPDTTGADKVLLDSVCEPVSVATVESMAKVTPVPEAVESIPVPPKIPKDSESRSMSMLVEPSVTSRSCAVTCEST